jgi:hypothetical protein
MIVESIGHGAGDDRKGPMPNVLRAVIGRSSGSVADRVVCLETNLDDFIPEHFDHLMERLLEGGALDVSVQHQQMKKNRPGFLVRVLARPSRWPASCSRIRRRLVCGRPRANGSCSRAKRAGSRPPTAGFGSNWFGTTRVAWRYPPNTTIASALRVGPGCRCAMWFAPQKKPVVQPLTESNGAALD